jgi:hypothetical protein
MEQTSAPLKTRKRRRTPLERTLSWPLNYPFLTALLILPGSVLILIAFVNLLTSEKPWPPAVGGVNLCIVYVNADGRLRVIEGSRDESFEALQARLLARITENATFVLPYTQQGQAVASYNGRFKYRILTPEGQVPQAIRTWCDHDNGRRFITTYEVSPDLLLPASYFSGLSPWIIALWTYPVSVLLLLPVLIVMGRRTRRRLLRRAERHREELKERADAAQANPNAPDQAKEKRRRRRRRRSEW